MLITGIAAEKGVLVCLLRNTPTSQRVGPSHAGELRESDLKMCDPLGITSIRSSLYVRCHHCAVCHMGRIKVAVVSYGDSACSEKNFLRNACMLSYGGLHHTLRCFQDVLSASDQKFGRSEFEPSGSQHASTSWGPKFVSSLLNRLRWKVQLLPNMALITGGTFGGWTKSPELSHMDAPSLKMTKKNLPSDLE